MELLTFNRDVIGPPQVLAECKRCSKTNRLAVEGSGWIWALSVLRCYYCRELFSPDWRFENWEYDVWG